MLLEFIIGAKTSALFDVWSIEHILSGLSAGHAVQKTNRHVFKKKLQIDPHTIQTHYFDIIGVLFIAYIWEVIEHYLETGLLGAGVEYWFQGVEFWANRIVTDPLMLVVGYLVAKKYPFLVVPARIASATWLITHIFFFPHSMYLHDLLIKIL